MLSPDTIQFLQAQAISTKASDLNTFTPTVILPIGGGAAQLLSIEQFQAQRSRFRGTMTTELIGEFVKYVTGRSQAHAFIDAAKIEALSCRAIFNLGEPNEPGHGDDTAVLRPKMTAGFAAMRAIAGKKLSQRDLIDWVEDWHLQVDGESTDGSPMGPAQIVAGIRHMKIVRKGEASSKVGDNAVSRSAMDEVEAKSAEVMPAKIIFTTEPFAGFKVRCFTLRISTITGDGEPQLSLRWQQQEAQCEDIAQEFKEILNKEIGGLAKVVVGTFELGK